MTCAISGMAASLQKPVRKEWECHKHCRTELTAQLFSPVPFRSLGIAIASAYSAAPPPLHLRTRRDTAPARADCPPRRAHPSS